LITPAVDDYLKSWREKINALKLDLLLRFYRFASELAASGLFQFPDGRAFLPFGDGFFYEFVGVFRIPRPGQRTYIVVYHFTFLRFILRVLISGRYLAVKLKP
jgi:hypothetical protein